MSTREVRLELLLGRKVRDVDGLIAGRIEEIRADRSAEECYVRDFLLGPAALIRRMLGEVTGLPFARTMRLGAAAPICVPWELMDLSDPDRPRVTVSRKALTRSDRD